MLPKVVTQHESGQQSFLVEASGRGLSSDRCTALARNAGKYLEVKVTAPVEMTAACAACLNQASPACILSQAVHPGTSQFES